MAAARRYGQGQVTHVSMLGSMLFWAALSLAPDADVIGFGLGVRYADPWGHRGATHSLCFAIAVALALGAVAPLFRADRWRTFGYATVVLVSHPVLDAMTTGGLGCALFWPFDLTRYFAPLRLIPVAPIGNAFFSTRGLNVALVELLLFAPALAYALWPRSSSRRR